MAGHLKASSRGRSVTSRPTGGGEDRAEMFLEPTKVRTGGGAMVQEAWLGLREAWLSYRKSSLGAVGNPIAQNLVIGSLTVV